MKKAYGWAGAALVGALGLGGYLVASGAEPAADRGPASVRSYTVMGQTVELHELEKIPSEEGAAIEGTNRLIAEYLKKTYLDQGPTKDPATGVVFSGTRRGVHPKAHGCLSGQLTVASQLADHDRVGIFATPGRQYPVLARFSNASPYYTNDDRGADSRGFGLKVMGVDGKPLLANAIGGPEAGATTQEFTMNNAEAFFADTAARYRRFMEISLKEKSDFTEAATAYTIEIFEHFHPFLGWQVKTLFETMQNDHPRTPLSTRYYSMTAQQHGTGPHAPVVKYSLEPCTEGLTDQIDANNPHYLRENLRRHMATQPACFRFLVQDPVPGKTPDIENGTQIWDQAKSPFRELARVEFPAQPLMEDLACEHQVFNPWNTLAEHKPLGGINRLRLAAYLLSIEQRKQTNHY